MLETEVWALAETRQFVWELSRYQIWIFSAKIESGTEFQASNTNRTFLTYMVQDAGNSEIWALVEAWQFVWELSRYWILIFCAKIESGTEF